jgi:hypothetical protein
MSREGMNILEVWNLMTEITKLEQAGWSLKPEAVDMVRVDYPAYYIQVKGMVPDAHEMFGNWWNAICWCKGFTRAME